MAAGTRSKSASVSTSSSLMQDVPGAFPMQYHPADEADDDDEVESTPQTLSQAVYARRSEYVRPREVRIKVGSWNVAAIKGTEHDVGGWFVGGKGITESLAGLDVSKGKDDRTEPPADQEARYARNQETLPKGDEGRLPGNEDVGLYVLGLQEVVDVNSATEALRPYTDPSVAIKWKDSIAQALPKGYQLVAEQQLIGLLLLIYAAPDLTGHIKSVSTTSVGTGLMGYMGNKGAVTARIVLGETTRLVFINSHLAAGADKAALERRNWDAQQIVSRTRFSPIQDAMDLSQSTGESLGDEDFAFWCGDLNYRLEGIPGDDVRRLLTLHTRNEYDISQPPAHDNDTDDTSQVPDVEGDAQGKLAASSIQPDDDATLVGDIQASEDPMSLQTTLSSLLTHDELHQQMSSRKAFHDGWREGPITFMPTYKYDPGTLGVFDSSEKRRAPSWCDRILYRTRRDKVAFDVKVRDEENARKKDEEMKANGTDQAANDEEILYDYDPDTDGGADLRDEYDEYDDTNDGTVFTKEGFEDEMQLEYYTAHQRVLSSDHKPLDAIFKLKFDAVIPELKAKIHADVAKQLDKAENEGRPNVTVVIDAHHKTPETTNERVPEKFEGVWFGDVRWAQTKHRSLTVANTSRVPASWSFIERPTDSTRQPGIAPKWLQVKINNTMESSSMTTTKPIHLEPGETCTVELELRIFSFDQVQELNKEKQSLEDILVLRVENGRDHFIPVRANWLESTLGSSIDRLTRIPEGGIRKLQRQKPDSSSKRKSQSDPAKTSSESGAEREDEPVRFSAPRELFRLTEAVEELSTRIVAEWEMTSASSVPGPRSSSELHSPTLNASAPWHNHPAWPFDEDCWTESTTQHWEDALGEACNALDEDRPLEQSLPTDLPKLQRLYVLCSMLLTFLRSMPDGVISSELWTPVEEYLGNNEKAKRKPSIEDQRSAIQELLSKTPSHSISFILIMSMLERMIQEIAGTAMDNEIETAALSPVKRAGGTLKRMTHLGKQAQSSRKEQASAALAKIFAGPVIRTPALGGDKAKHSQERRKVEVLQIFLRRDESG